MMERKEIILSGGRRQHICASLYEIGIPRHLGKAESSPLYQH